MPLCFLPRRTARRVLPTAFALLATLTAHAQAPAWDGAYSGATATATVLSSTRAVATDARGNVFVTGRFEGTVSFGSTTLTSAGGVDLFVAKWVPATRTWAWAQRGGGTGDDEGRGIAVSGGRVYVTGSVYNNAGNTSQVGFGGSGTGAATAAVNGASSTASLDLVVVRYTDNGPTATYNWARVGGGIGTDLGYGIAVSGQQVYAGGEADLSATFGPTTLPTTNALYFDVLTRFTDTDLMPLAARASQATGHLALYPNPTHGAATLTGAQPGTVATVTDALGRPMAAATADAAGTAALVLPAGLPAGVYVVRAGATAVRLTVE